MALALALALAGSVSNVFASDKLKAGTFDPPRMAPEFTLQGSDGSPLKLDRYRGKVVLLGFGFTHCPEVCPTTLSMLAKARKQMGEQAKDVQIVYITVDPDRDNPLRMREYLTHFDASFIGGTGSAAELDKVRKDYGIAASKKMSAGAPGGYGVDHSSFTYVIDRKGSLRGLIPYGRSAGDVVHDVKILLKAQ
jgi:protein SCO1/2